MEKILTLPLAALFALYLVALDDPRSILIITIAATVAGGVRYGWKLIETGGKTGKIKINWLLFLLNILVSLGIGWFCALSLHYFGIIKDDVWGIALAAGVSGMFSSEIMRGTPLVFAKVSGKTLGIELTDDEIAVITERRKKGAATRRPRN